MMKMCQHNLPCSIVYAHCLLPGRAFASLYVLLFLEKEAEIGGRGLGPSFQKMTSHFLLHGSLWPTTLEKKSEALGVQKSDRIRFWMLFMPPKELWEAYSNRTVRPSRFRVRSISPIFFEVGIPNLVGGYIMGWGSVAYHFRVTVTLTSDLVFRIIVSGAYLLYYLRLESQIWCVGASWNDEVSHTIIGSL